MAYHVTSASTASPVVVQPIRYVLQLILLYWQKAILFRCIRIVNTTKTIDSLLFIDY